LVATQLALHTSDTGGHGGGWGREQVGEKRRRCGRRAEKQSSERGSLAGG
jgi:hypothetical protein